MTLRRFMTREELIGALETYHSDEDVKMFIGVLLGSFPELAQVKPERMVEAWEQFKTVLEKSR